jgi:hypothetical protein
MPEQAAFETRLIFLREAARRPENTDPAEKQYSLHDAEYVFTVLSCWRVGYGWL